MPSGRGYFVPGLVALVALVGMGALFDLAVLPQRPARSLAGPDVATYLSQAIQAQRQLSGPPNVSCPPNEAVRAGMTFSCTWHLPTGDRAVRVVEAASPGQFRFAVSRPTP